MLILARISFQNLSTKASYYQCSGPRFSSWVNTPLVVCPSPFPV